MTAIHHVGQEADSLWGWHFHGNAVSTEGGSEFVIVAMGLDKTPENNQLEFECYFLDGTPLSNKNVVGPQLSRKFPFKF